MKEMVCMAKSRPRENQLKFGKKIVPLHGPHSQLTKENKELMGQE